MTTAQWRPAVTTTPLLDVRKDSLAVGLAVLLPVFVHLIPYRGMPPLGAQLLPLYFAPLLSVLFGRVHFALLLAWAAPFANHLLTGQPSLLSCTTTALELTAFSLVAAGLCRAQWILAAGPLAYLAERAALLTVRTAAPTLLAPAHAPFWVSLRYAAPGLAAFAVLAWGVRSLRRPGD